MLSSVNLQRFFLVVLFALLRFSVVLAQDIRGPVNRGSQQVTGAARISPNQPAELSFEQAIQLAIKNNLATLLSHERRSEARGLKQQALSPLLPNVAATAYQSSSTLNLVAIGFQPGAIPGFDSPFLGPFKNFDARVALSQTIFDLSAIRSYQAAQAGVRIAEIQEALAREQVANGVGLIYLEAVRSERAVLAAEADVELARALLTLAQDQRNAGVATGVDVIRAQTRLAQQQVELAQAQTDSEQSRLNLQRVVGLPLGGPLTLTDQLRFNQDDVLALDLAVAQAGRDRREIQVAEAQLNFSKRETQAARAEHLPSLEFVGDYGSSGITPRVVDLPTRRVAIQLNVPIFNGGLTRGRVTAAESRQKQDELFLSNIRGQVEEDVRLAMVTLRTAAVQVQAANETVTLAQRELEMSRDRFKSGVADNLEVVTAQTTLANARNIQVTALAQHNAARLNLAAALGRAEAFRW
jgi:outer membrane protein TolC